MLVRPSCLGECDDTVGHEHNNEHDNPDDDDDGDGGGGEDGDDGSDDDACETRAARAVLAWTNLILIYMPNTILKWIQQSARKTQ